jgi:hypothetical protein
MKNLAAPTLDSFCRGLVGYISYLAVCQSRAIYSEYLLYEPLLRIAQAKQFDVACEVPVNVPKALGASPKGDKKRMDFYLVRGEIRFGLEVKWPETEKPNLENDAIKLIQNAADTRSEGYVLLFGKEEYITNLAPVCTKPSLAERDAMVWSTGRTAYAAKWIRYV